MTTNGSTQTDVTFVEVTAQPTLVVQFNFEQREIGELMGAALETVHDYLKTAQIQAAGPPFTRYLVWTDDQKRAESGFPVEWAVEGGDLVVASALPSGRVARLVHTGPYSGLMEAKNQVLDAIRNRGLTPDGGPIEIYVTNPYEETDDTKYQTEIIWPIE